MVFIMAGCSACEEFLPRLQRAARAKGLRLNVHDVNTRYGQYLADEHKIKATPTTIGRCSRGTIKKKVGGLRDADLNQFLAALP